MTKEERKKQSKEAERRQTQCFVSAPAGAGRATESPACAAPPLRARSPVGVPLTVLPLGLVVAKVRLQAMLPGTWRSADPVVVPIPGAAPTQFLRVLPAPKPVPVQRAPRSLVCSARRLMPETARVRVVTPPRGAPPPPPP